MAITPKDVHLVATKGNSLAIARTGLLPDNEPPRLIIDNFFSVPVPVVLLVAD